MGVYQDSVFGPWTQPVGPFSHVKVADKYGQDPFRKVGPFTVGLCKVALS